MPLLGAYFLRSCCLLLATGRLGCEVVVGDKECGHGETQDVPETPEILVVHHKRAEERRGCARRPARSGGVKKRL